MSTFPAAASPQRFDQISRRSRMIYHWRAAELTLEALTRQTPTFTRTSDGDGTDSAAGTATYPNHHPAFQVTSERVGVLVGAHASADDWRYEFLARPQAMTVYLEFIERGTASGDALLWIGETDASTPYFRIMRAANGYQGSHHNGSAERTSTLSAAPSSGQVVQLRATLASTGVVQIHQSINGAAESSASASSSNTLASAWSGEVLMIGSRATNNPAAAEVRVIKIAAGVQTLATMESAF